ncbi:hypothetical protein Syun_020511 [Stephania yunnanensis]|uniref:Uncharacterized protein n=1 Tax=Stephania yunnanensis TaxID=152371 RepID=A0AAP0IDX0_9MAGN
MRSTVYLCVCNFELIMYRGGCNGGRDHRCCCRGGVESGGGDGGEYYLFDFLSF